MRTTKCLTCSLEFDGEHPTFLGGSKPRAHATCEKCGGEYGPGERAWWVHCGGERHQRYLNWAGVQMLALLERLPVVLDHNATVQSGGDVVFDLAA